MDKLNASILLISNNEEEYEFLKNAGFTNICYFPSYTDAIEFYKCNFRELDKFDLVLFSEVPVILENQMYNIRDYLMWNEISYLVFRNYDNDKINIILPDYSVCEKDLFISVILNKIKEPIKGNMVKNEIKKVEKVLPKTKIDVKILVLGCYDELPIIEKYLETIGFDNVETVEAINKNIYNNLNKLKDYDIIIADDNLVSNLRQINEEIRSQQLSTNKKTHIFLYANYDDYAMYNKIEVLGLPTEKGEECCEAEIEYFGRSQEGLKIIIDTIFNMYSKYNKLSDFEPVEDFSMYQKYVEERREYESVLENRYRTLNYIKQCIGHFNNYVLQGKLPEKFKSLKLNRISDGLSISMFVGPREVACLTFLDEDNPDNYGFGGVFYLQRLSEKGKLLPPKKIVLPSFDEKDKIPNAITEEEIKIVYAIEKRIKEEFIPEYDKIEQKRIKEEDERRKNNKRRVKKWD